MMRALLQGKSVIPQRVKASATVAQATRFDGELPISMLPRLASALADARGVLQVDLQGASPRGEAQLRGRVQGRLPLQCQRCERCFDWSLTLQLDLRLVASEADERRLLQDADPYWVQDDQLPLHELIEDEVLLELPMLPRCPACDTAIRQQGPQSPSTDAPAPDRRENPFAALKGKLKDK